MDKIIFVLLSTAIVSTFIIKATEVDKDKMYKSCLREMECSTDSMCLEVDDVCSELIRQLDTGHLSYKQFGRKVQDKKLYIHCVADCFDSKYDMTSNYQDMIQLESDCEAKCRVD